MTRFLTIAIALGAGGLIWGCGTGTAHVHQEDELVEVHDAPVWVTHDCQRAFVGDRVVLCGVGSMSGSSNHSLARNTAMARARTDLARTLQVRVKAMVKDYQAVTTDNDAVSDEQHVVDVSKQVTRANLRGTRLVDTYVAADTYWALVALDLATFEASLKHMGALDPRVKQAIMERASKAFGALDKE